MALIDDKMKDNRTGVTSAGGATGATAIFVPGGLRNVRCFAQIEIPLLTTTTATGTLTFSVYSSATSGGTYVAIGAGTTPSIAVQTAVPGPTVRIGFTPTNDDQYFKIGLSAITTLTLSTMNMNSSLVFSAP
ncbi:MAG TPA: hypothetical protein PK308_05230 [Phycisphaerales bacterium]|nr:hypothetical protein [Phycisphaerales bacterium]